MVFSLKVFFGEAFPLETFLLETFLLGAFCLELFSNKKATPKGGSKSELWFFENSWSAGRAPIKPGSGLIG
jgi:hypothetical protein